ncbi:DNA-binding MarR family transcriptional regulator [Deinococcus sp. HSC-46F16]|uniref:MarR family winged helix-turn-helix transcriptional regulator n=1 Tax=Deinococcus sp. HSC-46F16 TaxID=2910968 RepID=UPI00209FBECB|nr:MarR family transcriptional regulator [Deinococcus sp. HSC-46F16]MCP2014596.1 DNA-binding MarR family transcriptional regulator [Deinococcus sp. HSC-46F16]
MSLPTLPHPEPASSLEHQVYLGLQRLAADLGHQTAELLKGSGLSLAQFNVLRILRGAGEGGLTCGEIGERLITRDSDVTRLLDRLEKQALVTRTRSTQDRRVVLSTLTDQGRALLADLDAPLAALHRAQLGSLGPHKLRHWLTLLGEAAAASQEVG